jgi:hypothetical protein
MLHALRSEMPDALLVAPDRTRTNLQGLLDAGELQRLCEEGAGSVVLWLDDLEGFVRVGDNGLDTGRLEKLKREIPGLVVAATAGGRGLRAHADSERTQLQQPLSDLLAGAACEPLLAGDARHERCAVQRDLQTRPDDATAIRAHHTRGYGSTARWAHRPVDNQEPTS